MAPVGGASAGGCGGNQNNNSNNGNNNNSGRKGRGRKHNHHKYIHRNRKALLKLKKKKFGSDSINNNNNNNKINNNNLYTKSQLKGGDGGRIILGNVREIQGGGGQIIGANASAAAGNQSNGLMNGNGGGGGGPLSTIGGGGTGTGGIGNSVNVRNVSILSKFVLPSKPPCSELSVPPRKFLLGGNISDPLNLNSLQDEGNGNNIGNGGGGGRENFLENPHHHKQHNLQLSALKALTPPKVKVLIPPNIHDPLHLLSPVETGEYRQMLLVQEPNIKNAKRKRKHYHRSTSINIVQQTNSIGTNNNINNNNQIVSTTSTPIGNTMNNIPLPTNSLIHNTNDIEDNDVGDADDDTTNVAAPTLNNICTNNNNILDAEQKENFNENKLYEIVPANNVDEIDKNKNIIHQHGHHQYHRNGGGGAGSSSNALMATERKRKTSEGSGLNYLKKIRRMDSKDKIVSPVIPQPGTWKRPPIVAPMGAPQKRHRYNSQSQSAATAAVADVGVGGAGDNDGDNAQNKIDLLPIDDDQKDNLNDIDIEKSVENQQKNINVRKIINNQSKSRNNNKRGSRNPIHHNYQMHRPNILKNDEDVKYRYGNRNSYLGVTELTEYSDVRLTVFLRNANLFNGKDVLDVGCNMGLFTIAIGRTLNVNSITGIDIDENNISIAKRNLAMYERLPINNLPPLAATATVTAANDDDGDDDNDDAANSIVESNTNKNDNHHHLQPNYNFNVDKWKNRKRRKGKRQQKSQPTAAQSSETENEPNKNNNNNNNFFPISFPLTYRGIPKLFREPSTIDDAYSLIIKNTNKYQNVATSTGTVTATATGTVTTTAGTGTVTTSTTATAGNSSSSSPRPASSSSPVEQHKLEFPDNVFFFTQNYVQFWMNNDQVNPSNNNNSNNIGDAPQQQQQQPQYDLILCLSVTKWIHLNFGDDALKYAFKRMFNQLRPGGALILESQNWPSYRKKKKITKTIYEKYKSIQFYPNSFHQYLMSGECGFSHYRSLAVPYHCSKGFRRPITLYCKGDFTPSRMRWSDSHHPRTPLVMAGKYWTEFKPFNSAGNNNNNNINNASSSGGPIVGSGNNSARFGNITPFTNFGDANAGGSGGNYIKTPYYIPPTSQYYNPMESDSYLPSYETEEKKQHYCFTSPLYSDEWSSPVASGRHSASHTPLFGSMRYANEGDNYPENHVYLPMALMSGDDASNTMPGNTSERTNANNSTHSNNEDTGNSSNRSVDDHLTTSPQVTPRQQPPQNQRRHGRQRHQHIYASLTHNFNEVDALLIDNSNSGCLDNVLANDNGGGGGDGGDGADNTNDDYSKSPLAERLIDPDNYDVDHLDDVRAHNVLEESGGDILEIADDATGEVHCVIAEADGHSEETDVEKVTYNNNNNNNGGGEQNSSFSNGSNEFHSSSMEYSSEENTFINYSTSGSSHEPQQQQQQPKEYHHQHAVVQNVDEVSSGGDLLKETVVEEEAAEEEAEAESTEKAATAEEEEEVEETSSSND